MSETFNEMALRVAKELDPSIKDDEEPGHLFEFARRIRDELCKGQEPVYQVWRSTDSCNEFYSWDDVELDDYNKALNENQRVLYLHPAPIPADMVRVIEGIKARRDLRGFCMPQDAADMIAAYEKEQKK